MIFKPTATLDAMAGTATLAVYDDAGTLILSLSYDNATDLVTGQPRQLITLPSADYQALLAVIQQWISTVLGVLAPKTSVQAAYSVAVNATDTAVTTVITAAGITLRTAYTRATGIVISPSRLGFSTAILQYQTMLGWLSRFVGGVS